MPYKRILLRLIAMILFIAGLFGSYIMSAFVFDRSYMRTQDALGEPGAELKLWVYFIVAVLFAVAGITLFVRSFRRKQE